MASLRIGDDWDVWCAATTYAYWLRTPVFVVFLISGIAMVSLITRLGKEHLIERATIAGALSSGLILLAQVTQISVLFSNGTPFLRSDADPCRSDVRRILIACLGWSRGRNRTVRLLPRLWPVHFFCCWWLGSPVQSGIRSRNVN